MFGAGLVPRVPGSGAQDESETSKQCPHQDDADLAVGRHPARRNARDTERMAIATYQS